MKSLMIIGLLFLMICGCDCSKPKVPSWRDGPPNVTGVVKEIEIISTTFKPDYTIVKFTNGTSATLNYLNTRICIGDSIGLWRDPKCHRFLWKMEIYQ